MKLINSVHNACDDSQSGIVPSSTVDYFVTPLCSAYNLPRLSAGMGYVRKMRIPGWTSECKGEIYLLWSPTLVGYKSGDIVEIGDKQYAVITEGAVCFASRVG